MLPSQSRKLNWVSEHLPMGNPRGKMVTLQSCLGMLSHLHTRGILTHETC
eukprot:jgi/Botrbrau1/14047/Bobra.0011s0013.1